MAQDAGYPQANCFKSCCQPAWDEASRARLPTSLAIVDPQTNEVWLLDCTWRLPDQLNLIRQAMMERGRGGGDSQPYRDGVPITGILLTHAHIGHYTGLIHLGREAVGSHRTEVLAMPRMKNFLQKNGPWDQLVKLENISLSNLENGRQVSLNSRITVTPVTVPHRDEYSETVGFLVKGPDRSLLYLPDIDKWERWEQRVEEVIDDVDLAFLDATFFANGEIPGRDMSQIPHPFVEESLLRFQGLPAEQRKKIQFIHLNHTNPALDPASREARMIERAGMGLARQGSRHDL